MPDVFACLAIGFAASLISTGCSESDRLPPESAFPCKIASHRITIEIDPEQHLLTGSDRPVFEPKQQRDFPRCRFTLNDKIEVREAVWEDTDEPARLRAGAVRESLRIYDVPIPDDLEPPWHLLLKIKGQLPPPEDHEGVSYKVGSDFPGSIQKEGAFLSKDTGWYADTPDSFSIYQLKVTVPTPYHAISQGRSRIVRKEEAEVSSWRSVTRTDSLALLVGPYRFYGFDMGGLRVRAALLAGDNEDPFLFPNEAKRLIEYYSDPRRIGRYPYSRFDIVESYFGEPGLGFPGFTLLGPGVIARGRASLRPGYLDHELVHNWYGNYVFTDPEGGNWAEGLTTYVANYLQTAEREGEEGARRYRKRVSLRYALGVNPKHDFPISQYEQKRRPGDAVIGYGKTAMFFHALRNRVGDKAFFQGLREFIRAHGGKRAGWPEIRKSFQHFSDGPLDEFFAQWIDRKRGPRLSLELDRLGPNPDGFLVEGRIVQRGNRYQLPLTIRTTDSSGVSDISVEVSSRETPFRIITRAIPRMIEADPDFEFFRLLSDAELTPCLSTTIRRGKPPLYVIAAEPGSEEEKSYRALAEEAKGHYGGKIVGEKALRESDLEKRSAMILGDPDRDELALSRRIPFPEPAAAIIYPKEGEGAPSPEAAVLATVRSPWRPGRWISVYRAASPEGLLDHPGRLFYYSYDSYVIFEDGKVVTRGDWDAGETPTRIFPARETASAISEDELHHHVAYLASPKLRGRASGTPGREAAARYIIEMLEAVSPERIRFNPEDTPGTPALVNILGRIDPLPGREPFDEAILIGAHYDSARSKEGSPLLLGADDNASGVAALIEIGQALAEQRHWLRRTVFLAAFDGEEAGLLGSKKLSGDPRFDEAGLRAVLNLDTIGGAGEPKLYLIGRTIYPGLTGIADAYGRMEELWMGEPIDRYAYKRGSDHYPFHLRGIPAFSFWSSDYKKMNSVKDTIERVDFAHLARVTRAAYLTALDLATAAEIPQ